jgi:hypothetical protein
MRLPKGMAAPSIRDYVRVCDRPVEAGPPSAAVPPPPEEDDYGDLRISDDDVPF